MNSNTYIQRPNAWPTDTKVWTILSCNILATFYVLGHFSVRLNNGNFLALAPILRPPDSVPLTINALLHSLSLSLSLSLGNYSQLALFPADINSYTLSPSLSTPRLRERERGSQTRISNRHKNDVVLNDFGRNAETYYRSSDPCLSLSLSFLRFFGAKILSTFESSSSSSLSSSSSSHLFLAFSTKRAKNNF